MFAVIMAGGSGTRFWPASRASRPKQFLQITSERTMFEETVNRVRRLVDDERIYAVVNSLHAELTRQLLGQSEAQVLVEPVGRNTAPCIGLVAVHAMRRAADEPIVVLPSDHFVADVEGFAQTIRAAAEVARSGAIVTLGISPTRPETGYGYIEVGAEHDSALNQAYFQVERFVEKPDHQTALAYLSSGRYLWNSGIFIFTPRTILNEIETCLPSLHAGLLKIESAIDSTAYPATVESVYGELDSVSIDYGVMEKTTAPVYVFKSEFGWSDVGSWDALYELRRNEADEHDNLLLGDTLVLNSERNLVYSGTNRLVALMSVEGLIVVDTPDALLVADLDHAQDVKQLPKLLKRRDRTEIC